MEMERSTPTPVVLAGIASIMHEVPFETVVKTFMPYLSIRGVNRVVYFKVRFGFWPFLRKISATRVTPRVVQLQFADAVDVELSRSFATERGSMTLMFVNALATFDYETAMWYPRVAESGYRDTEVPILIYRESQDTFRWQAERMPLQYPIAVTPNSKTPSPDELVFALSLPSTAQEAGVVFPGMQQPNFVSIPAQAVSSGTYQSSIDLFSGDSPVEDIRGAVQLTGRVVSTQILGTTRTYSPSLYEPRIGDMSILAWNKIAIRFNQSRVTFFRPVLPNGDVSAHRYVQVSWQNAKKSVRRTYWFVDNMPVHLRGAPGRSLLDIATDRFVEHPEEFERQRDSLPEELIRRYNKRITTTVDENEGEGEIHMINKLLKV